jgi:hypothetical protein
LWTNFETASFLVIKQCSKDGWRIEIRVAQKIDRAIHSHERDRLHIADNTVILDWVKGHVAMLSRRYSTAMLSDGGSVATGCAGVVATERQVTTIVLRASKISQLLDILGAPQS